MSITDLIVDRVRRRMLYPLYPRMRGDVARRALLLSEEIHNALERTTGDREWEIRRGLLRADLEVFVTSERIDPKYLFHLYPARDCVWEIRSVRDQPSIRVLGLFADKDTFVTTGFALREDLGGWNSREWKAVKRAARAKWNTLFHTYRPIAGIDAKQHVTGAVDGKFFRDRG